jgi:hypothetical protein
MAISLLVAKTVGPAKMEEPRLSLAASASALALFALLPSGPTVTGEMGVFFWTALGLALASRGGDGALESTPMNSGTRRDLEVTRDDPFRQQARPVAGPEGN